MSDLIEFEIVTPERASLEPGLVFLYGHEKFGEVEGPCWHFKATLHHETARRIAACVNACRGTTTNGLGDGPTYSDLWNEIQTIKKSVDDDGTHGGPSVLVEQALEAKADALRERDEARAMVARLSEALRNAANENYRDEWEELADEADESLIPPNVMCPKCFCVTPGKPDTCPHCGEALS